MAAGGGDAGGRRTGPVAPEVRRGAGAPPLPQTTEIKVIGVRRVIAERMSEAKRNIPHFAYVEEVDVTELEALRQHLNAQAAKGEPALTYLPLSSSRLARSLDAFPQCNVLYDAARGVLVRHRAVHVGIATQTPDGLKVPVVRNAQALGLWELAAEIRRVSERARSNKATREELVGSTITVTSLGKLGGIASTPVINAPEVAIIGLNKAVERPVVHQGAIVVRRIMNLSSSFDHRFVDGYDAAAMIQALKELLEHPATILSKVRPTNEGAMTAQPTATCVRHRPDFAHGGRLVSRRPLERVPRSSRSGRSNSAPLRTCCITRARASRDSRHFAAPTDRSTSFAWTGTSSACARARAAGAAGAGSRRSSPTWCARSSSAAAKPSRKRRVRSICGRSCSARRRTSAPRRPLRADALLLVLASPVWDYFAGGMKPLRILVDDEHTRSAAQMGMVKTGGNYAAAIGPTLSARAKYQVDQVLFCPGGEVQETGAANFLLVRDGELLTRGLDSTFLHGVTRDSLLTLARDKGYRSIGAHLRRAAKCSSG